MKEQINITTYRTRIKTSLPQELQISRTQWSHWWWPNCLHLFGLTHITYQPFNWKHRIVQRLHQVKHIYDKSKSKGLPITGPEGPEWELYSSFNLGARSGWVVNVTPRPLYTRESHGTHCIGGWVGPRAGLDGCGKSRPHRDSIPGPSSP